MTVCERLLLGLLPSLRTCRAIKRDCRHLALIDNGARRHILVGSLMTVLDAQRDVDVQASSAV